YSGQCPPLPSHLLTGNTYRHAFGVNSSILENLILDLNLMGPQWLLLKNPQMAEAPVTWCKLELSVSKASQQISIDSFDSAPPDFTVMSLNFKTSCNPDTKVNEIIAVSCLTNRSFN